jgi:hypothetical protein
MSPLLRRLQQPVAPALPGGPFYLVEDRGDGPQLPPFSSEAEDLVHAPAPPQPPRAPSFQVGQQVVAVDIDDVLTRQPLVDPGRSMHSWPVRIYQLESLQGLRWKRPHSSWEVHWKSARVAAEVPAWRYFGPHGQEVPGLLDRILVLDPERVMQLPVDPQAAKFQVPGKRIAVPDEPLHPARRAAFHAMLWLEARGWQLGDEAGGHYYRGCYFNYNLSEPHWLAALGIVMDAAAALALGPELDPAERQRVLTDWQRLLA